jgi:hypothetical protein
MVADRLGVGAVRVEDEGAVVVRVVLLAAAWKASTVARFVHANATCVSAGACS